MMRAAQRRAARLMALALLGLLPPGPTLASQPQFEVTTPASADAPTSADRVTVVIKSQHRRLAFGQDIQRIAVGDADILSAELITSREVLVLGRETGRTTLIVWFGDGSFREYLFSVQHDLSLLERALKLVHPSIAVESAPDRDALVLTGTVPNVLVSQTAEAVARNYLDAGSSRNGGAQPLVAVPTEAGGAPAELGTVPGQPESQPAGVAPVPQGPGPAGAPRSPAAVQLQGAVQSSGTIINLIQLETLPLLPEEKIYDAIRALGGKDVTIRRMVHGNLPDDTRDTLVLEGSVPTQVALVRVLAVAAQMFAGQTISAEDIRVVADEAGALAQRMQAQNAQSQSMGGGATSSLFGGTRGARLTNEVRTNLGRAKAVEVASGRILSFIEVKDLPQVRVDIRLEEINRSKLQAFEPNWAVIASDFRQPSLNPAQSATVVQGEQAARVGANGAAVQNVLSFLNGILANQFQYAGSHAAIDLVLALLERQGIARSLSSPSLTVLSGESAQVQVGGEVPVPTAFAPAFGGTVPGAVTPGVFSSVEFVPFGVQLQVRPLVGDDDSITLDVQPLIMTPDALLTNVLRQTTGTNLPTTAFKTRALRTSAKLQDGQALLIGGLVSNNSSSNANGTPGLKSLPLIGKLFEGFNHNDESTELIVVVNPVLVRTPVPETALWAFPDRDELIRTIMARVNAVGSGKP